MTPAQIIALMTMAYQVANQLGLLAKLRVEEDEKLTEEEKKALIDRITAAQNSVPEWK